MTVASATAASASDVGGGWVIQPTPLPAGATQGRLRGIECGSSANCTAVGDYTGAQDSPLVERWQDGAWSPSTAAVPAQASGASLAGVYCETATHCVVVGSYDSGGSQLPLAEESGNGGGWQVQDALPLPTGGVSGSLTALSCGSTSECTAVGTYDDAGGLGNPLAERWNGHTWSVQSVPVPAGADGSSLAGVSCPTLSSCFAAGQIIDPGSDGVISPLLESWDGSSWTIQSVPTPLGSGGGSLSGISCAAPTQCIAVGDYHGPSGTLIPLGEALADGTWSAYSPPVPAKTDGGSLTGVSCHIITACTAVGQYTNENRSGMFALADTWNGTSWHRQAMASPVRYRLPQGVACIASKQCAAAGYVTNQTALKAEPLAESSIIQH